MQIAFFTLGVFALPKSIVSTIESIQFKKSIAAASCDHPLRFPSTIFENLIKRGLIFGMAIALGCAGERPANLGIIDGRLAPCPDSPNCVSSQSADESHRIEPLRYIGSADSVRQNLRKLVESMPRTKIVTQTDSYIHAEFTIALMGFVDDVEFHFDDENKIIHVRSASRVGHSDFGVNRRRVEKIRNLWQQLHK